MNAREPRRSGKDPLDGRRRASGGTEGAAEDAKLQGPHGLQVEFRQSELHAVTATVVDVLMTWMFDEEALKNVRFN